MSMEDGLVLGIKSYSGHYLCCSKLETLHEFRFQPQLE